LVGSGKVAGGTPATAVPAVGVSTRNMGLDSVKNII